MIENKNNKLTLTYLLELSGVSKSGYYGFMKQTDSKLFREFNDEEKFELIMSLVIKEISTNQRMNGRAILREQYYTCM
jgi:hypothetical protein